ncbi:transcriptional regulator [Geomicrobium sp. JCM 19037]|uniref:GntR family transcriptional regulator n=1 Tax=unclassified Geomicrobium TaxID=2628951 RepID=UPI00045F1BB3|nr:MULTISPECIES: GntR family transcriptional regulator [unclassified Geomicrobium]GAK03042.1 transcriptional regulator [Geomicrobium sp. JCM 19037]GAK13964.1 transcriptional regulator [Geomicrobium sp. JCM 19039]
MTERNEAFFSVDPNLVKSLRELVVEKIREGIVSGYFEEGEHLKEREISSMMGISTTPVKEAFRILENEGMLVTVPRKGTFVSEYASTSIEEILLLRASVESLCARLAALKMTDEELNELEQQMLIIEGLHNKGDSEALIEQNSIFHQQIIDGARNVMMHNILGNLRNIDKAFRKRALKIEVEREVGFQEHYAVFEAIRARDPERAEATMKAHILRTKDNILAAEQHRSEKG